MALQIMIVQKFPQFLKKAANNGKRWGEVEQPLGSVVLKRGEQSQSDWLLAGTNGFDGSNHDMMFFNEGERSYKMNV